jgi:hypothetical protein
MSGGSERVVSATGKARQSKSRQQDKETAHVMCIVASGERKILVFPRPEEGVREPAMKRKSDPGPLPLANETVAGAKALIAAVLYGTAEAVP